MELYDRILRIAQLEATSSWGQGWLPLYAEEIKEKDGSIKYGIAYPQNDENGRVVYVYSYLYSLHGVHLNEQQENALFAEKEKLAENIRELHQKKTVYLYDADYCAVKPISEQGVTLGYDFIIRCRPYMTLGEYVKLPEIQELLRDASEDAEQKRTALVDTMIRRIMFALKECSQIGIVHGRVDFQNIWLDKALTENQEFRLSFPGMRLFIQNQKEDRQKLDECAAPELFRDENKPFDEQTDLYSLGVVLYYLLNEGMFPFQTEGMSVEEALRIRNEGMEEIAPPKHGTLLQKYIIRKLLSNTRENRYQDIAELETDARRKHNKADVADPMSVITVSSEKMQKDAQEIAEKKAQEERLKKEREEANRAKAQKERVQQSPFMRPKSNDIPIPKPQKQPENVPQQGQSPQPPQYPYPQRPQQTPPSPTSLKKTTVTPTNPPIQEKIPQEEIYDDVPPERPKGGCSGCLVRLIKWFFIIVAIIVVAVIAMGVIGYLLSDDTSLENPENVSSSVLVADNDNNGANSQENFDSSSVVDSDAEAEPKNEEDNGLESYDLEFSFETQAPESEYVCIVGKYTWEEARDYCEANGGQLATIHSEEDWNRMIDKVEEAKSSNSALKYVWLGAKSELVNDDSLLFSWVDGTDVSFIMNNFDHWYYNERFETQEPSGYDAYQYYVNDVLVREPYLLLWNVAPRSGSTSQWSLNDVPDVSDYSEYTSSNMGFVMETKG